MKFSFCENYQDIEKCNQPLLETFNNLNNFLLKKELDIFIMSIQTTKIKQKVRFAVTLQKGKVMDVMFNINLLPY